MGLDVLQIAVSVMAVVSEEWMERFVINLVVLCSDGLASAEDPARGSSDVGSEICVVSDPLPTAVSVLLGVVDGPVYRGPACRRVRYSASVWPTVG